MKFIFEQADLKEPEVIIRGNLSNQEVQNLMALLGGGESDVRKKPERMELYRDEEQFYICVRDIQYFAANDDIVYAHCSDGLYRAKDKLYRIKDELENAGFVQINKSVVLNTAFVRSVQAEFSGNYIVTLKKSGEKLVISRRYFREFREKM